MPEELGNTWSKQQTITRQSERKGWGMRCLIGAFVKPRHIPWNFEGYAYVSGCVHTRGCTHAQTCAYAQKRFEKALDSHAQLTQSILKQEVEAKSELPTAWLNTVHRVVVNVCIDTHTEPLSKAWNTYWMQMFKEISVQL